MILKLFREGHPTSVVNLRDGTKISAESGKEILNIFKRHPVELNIFDSFEYMDRREDYIRAQRDNDPEFQQLFEQSCTSNQSMQDSFYSQRKQYYYRPNGRRPNGNRKYSYNPIGNGSNGYFPKSTYHKKSEDRIRLNQHDFPSIQQSDEKMENMQQRRKYSEGQNYKRRNQNLRPFNEYHGSHKNHNNGTFYQEKNKHDEKGETQVKERERNTEGESNGSQGKQDVSEVQPNPQGKVYGDHSQLC